MSCTIPTLNASITQLPYNLTELLQTQKEYVVSLKSVLVKNSSASLQQ